MFTSNNETKVNEFCEKGRLENYRDILIDIFQKIDKQNCKISARYDIEQSSYSNCQIRISLKNNKQEPIHILWIIFHEFGHHCSGTMNLTDRNNVSKRKLREQLAWDFARKMIMDYPTLINQISNFEAYQKKCLASYGK